VVWWKWSGGRATDSFLLVIGVSNVIRIDDFSRLADRNGNSEELGKMSQTAVKDSGCCEELQS